MTQQQLRPEVQPRPIIGASVRPKRRLRWLRWTVGLLGLVLALALVLTLFRDSILKSVLRANLYRETGLKAEIGGLHLGLTTASLHITNLKLLNPPGFGDDYLMDLPELYLQLRPATNETGVAFREIRIHLATLNVVRNPHGQFNLQALDEPIKRRRHRPRRKHRGETFAGIDRIFLTLGTVNYIDLARPRRNQSHVLDIKNARTNLRTEEELKTWAGGLLGRLFLKEIFRDPPALRHIWKWLLDPPRPRSPLEHDTPVEPQHGKFIPHTTQPMLRVERYG